LISIGITMVGGIGTLWLAGMAYALLGPLQWMNGAYMAKRLPGPES
jgi:hypothetical protein